MRILRDSLSKPQAWHGVLLVMLIATIGTVNIYHGKAAPVSIALEPETGAVSLGAAIQNDTTASQGKAVKFSAVTPSPVPPAISFRGDFETGDVSQFNGLECPNQSQQLQITTNPVRQGKYAARMEIAPGDNWPDDNTIRCLAANYNTDEKDGQEYYYALSMYFPQTITAETLLWELHTRKEIYSVPGAGVVPHALIIRDGKIEYRLLSGLCTWNGTSWTGWEHTEWGIPVTQTIPVNQWVDFIVHIKFSETDGTVEVWSRTGEAAWPQTPQVARYHVPTLQTIPGGKDPAIPQAIHTSSLYGELGLYNGLDHTSTTDVVYQDGYRRGATKDAVMAEFPLPH